jgi:hypothetical protein
MAIPFRIHLIEMYLIPLLTLQSFTKPPGKLNRWLIAYSFLHTQFKTSSIFYMKLFLANLTQSGINLTHN